MDYSSVDSEIMDSLEILRPRVKRLHENTRVGNNNVYRGKFLNPHRDHTEHRHIASDCEGTAASSTSLILKKTSQREILKKYSILSYTSLLRANRNPGSEQTVTARDKPLIKVTVIPKTQGQTSKLHRRRKPTKKIQNSVSNQENSIHAKNLYLVVAGRRREKVYEIKTTGSANFSSDALEYRNHDDNSLRERSSIKEVIQSLNMDKKKRKGKNRKDTKRVDVPETHNHHDCRCWNLTREDRNMEGKILEGRRSRIRIIGEVGLTEDERYVLKCDATVDGEPIMNRFDSEKTRAPQYNVTDASETTKYHTNYNTMACYGGYCSNSTYNRRDFRDSNVQVDFGIDQNGNNSMFRSMENQGTQVNFNVCPSRTMLPAKKHQTIQCNYTSITSELDHKLVQGCQSPLVIISVYPKQETSIDAKNINHYTATTARPSSPTSIPYNSQETRSPRNDQNKNDRSPKPSRTPSPTRKHVDMQSRKDKHQADNKMARTRTASPTRSPTRLNRPTPNNERKKSNQRRIIDDSETFICNNMKKINQILSSRGLKNTNTEIKKAIVDDYTKMITESINRYAESTPKHDTSKVKINIDSENEYYDVQFEQGQRTTELQIRKTLKEAASQKHQHKERSVSPDMFLLPERETKGKPFAQCKHERKDDTNVGHSKTNVRDSIDIPRQEFGPSKKNVKTNKSIKQNVRVRDTDFFAPIKHFKGDDCELPNPVERDKQIRQLLGINRVKTSGGTKQNDALSGVVNDRGLLNCNYKRGCEKNIETGISLNDFGACYEITPANKNIKPRVTQMQPPIEQTSLYQQFILNRNIQVFLQIEQLPKQKPIILSRKQYDKVKRTIQKSVTKKISQEKRKKPIYKNSLVSVGEVRKRNKLEPLKYECNKHTQTDLRQDEYKEPIDLNKKKRRHKSQRKTSRIDNHGDFPDAESPEMKTIVLFDSKDARCRKKNRNTEMEPPQPASSNFEIHYASVEYMKHVTFSSTNVGSLSTSSILRRNDSVFTIFKGRKRSVTPNLGTSDISLRPREVNSVSVRDYMSPEGSKLKKPFLRRLISCLVMRSRTSDVKIPVRTPHVTSVDSSVDSYQFSTSLGAVQMTSSLYDTTASFYTSHSVLPIVNSKMKRGFFNSVRGFLTNRKS